jgi:hypothetical protein
MYRVSPFPGLFVPPMGRRALTELSSQVKQVPVQELAVVDQMSGNSSLPKRKRRRLARIAADLSQASLQPIASGAACAGETVTANC